jgi:cobalt-precorrin 5A hydrolase/precorrin-3B C17-methyltransferase
VVGYRLYLDLAADLIQGRRHDFALGEEEARAAHAFELAAVGRRVALVSSGDPGVFAMAAVAFELLDRTGRVDWRRVELVVTPGASAMQAAAARAGAPLGHDFCAISLSDLLTPWPAIERRLRAAAEADFVVALYNPASRGRREPLLRALTILRESRPPNTPVVVARNLGRADERCEAVSLDALDPAWVDMLTLLIVGASTTKAGPTGVYTPRGYPGKVAP